MPGTFVENNYQTIHSAVSLHRGGFWVDRGRVTDRVLQELRTVMTSHSTGHSNAYPVRLTNIGLVTALCMCLVLGGCVTTSSRVWERDWSGRLPADVLYQ